MSKLWTNIKTKVNPGTLHSHAACKLPSSMLIFGGESNGHPSNDLWRFHFGKLYSVAGLTVCHKYAIQFLPAFPTSQVVNNEQENKKQTVEKMPKNDDKSVKSGGKTGRKLDKSWEKMGVKMKKMVKIWQK